MFALRFAESIESNRDPEHSEFATPIEVCRVVLQIKDFAIPQRTMCIFDDQCIRRYVRVFNYL